MFDTITILAVDDDIMSLGILEVILSDLGCTLLKAGNGLEALKLLEQEPAIDVVLLDLEMPVMNGYETIQLIKRIDAIRDIPVIVVTAGSSEVNRSLALGANDFIAKPYNAEELKLRTMNHVRSKKLAELARDMNDALEKEVARKTAALQEALNLSREAEYEISVRLGRAAEFRDQETGMHIRRISELSQHLAHLAGCSDEECEVLRFAAPLHDVGKIGIPDRILLKSGKLDHAELEMMQQHPAIGGMILSDAAQFPLIESGRIIALQHHEKWDGSGYPSGLEGDDIHIFARIVTIVDVFDALTSKRPYKEPFSLEATSGIMQEGRGTFFDPHLLDLFFANLEQFAAIKDSLPDPAHDEAVLNRAVHLDQFPR